MPTRVPAVPSISGIPTELRDWLHLVRVRLDEAVGAGGSTGGDAVEHGLSDHIDVTLVDRSVGDILRIFGFTFPGGSLSRPVSGLILRDDFDWADSTIIGNGWEEINTTSIQIVSGEVLIPSGTQGHLRRNDVAPSADILTHGGYLFHCNLRGAGFPSLEYYDAVGTLQSYSGGYTIDKNGAQLRLFRHTSLIRTLTLTTNPGTTAYNSIRFSITPNAGNFDLQMHAKDANVSSDQIVDLDLSTTVFSETTFPPSSGGQYHGGGFSAGAGIRWPFWFVCGRYITVQGVPSGFQVQVDSRTPVSSTGSDVVLDPKLWGLPATTLKILSPLGSELITLTPTGGIYGGDVFLLDSSKTIADWRNVPAIRDLGGVSGNFTVDYVAGLQQFVNITADVATTISLDGQFAGLRVDLVLRNGSGGVLTPGNFTWDSEIVWLGGSAPTLPANGDAIVVVLRCLGTAQSIGYWVGGSSAAGIADI